MSLKRTVFAVTASAAAFALAFPGQSFAASGSWSCGSGCTYSGFAGYQNAIPGATTYAPAGFPNAYTTTRVACTDSSGVTYQSTTNSSVGTSSAGMGRSSSPGGFRWTRCQSSHSVNPSGTPGRPVTTNTIYF